jgi:Reverse transcriptase (RNA-dependent DNA polymerase)
MGKVDNFNLDENSLDWALVHIEKNGDTDIFPYPFEYEAIRFCWNDKKPTGIPQNDIKPWLLSQNLLKWEPRPYRHCLVPKHKYGFRKSTQLDPLDTLIYTSLVYDIGDDIEKSRVPKAKKVAMSYRFKPNSDGRMYDEKYSWENFQKHSLAKAQKSRIKYVLVADIADFYPRIYSHPLENALRECTTKHHQVKVISHLIKKWNYKASYGIPVGQTASRLLAELVIDDVDKGLISEGIDHCRYVDDFRIFCKSERQALEHLSYLAHILLENHGLTLQQHKTKILKKDEFIDYIKPERNRELDNLAKDFSNILYSMGIDTNYVEIDFDMLSESDQDKINELNLLELLKKQLIDEHTLNESLLRFIIRRLGQVNKDCCDYMLANIDKLYPVFKTVMQYIQELRGLKKVHRHRVGKKLINILDKSIIGHLAFHRMWVFYTFTKDIKWDNEDQFVKLYNKNSDDFSRRKLILALGRSNTQSWFKSTKRLFMNLPDWEKRAFIVAASCLPGDEAKNWYDSIHAKLDPLERSLVKWAKANPFK